MDEIELLIKEQEVDGQSSFVTHDNLSSSGVTVIAVEPAKLVGIADAIQAKHDRQEKITWGQPAKITQVKMDKQCCCGAVRDEVIKKDHIILGGLDLRSERGKVVNCLCWSCGFAF